MKHFDDVMDLNDFQDDANTDDVDFSMSIEAMFEGGNDIPMRNYYDSEIYDSDNDSIFDFDIDDDEDEDEDYLDDDYYERRIHRT